MSEAFEDVVLRGRYDLYGPVHKGLRRAHADLLHQLGAADFSGDVSELLAKVEQHLALAEIHLEDEENHIHSAMNARLPGSADELDVEHGAHRATIASLRSIMGEFADASPAKRPTLGRALYIRFSQFVGQDFEHMAFEETVVWPSLCALFTDAELAEIEGRIVGSLAPEQMMAFLKLIIRASSPREREDMIQGLQKTLPHEAYEEVIATAGS